MNQMKMRSRILSLTLVLAMLVGMFTVSASAASGYLIEVDGTSFYSSQNRSGSGWRYDSEEEVLYLDNYRGGGIRALGDLVVYAEGTITVTGSNAAQTGQHGMDVAGTLYLYLFGDADMTITAGEGRNGGDGIHADKVYIDDDGESESVYANLTINAGRGTSAYGGDGINADDIYLWPDEGNVWIYGGKGYTFGGDGVIAGNIYCAPEYAFICGGQGVTRDSGNGIYHTGKLDVGICTMTVQSYDSSGYALAIPSGSDAGWHPSPYMNYEKGSSDYIYYMYPDEYTVTLDGAGGTLAGGKGSCSVTKSAGKYIELENYTFERDGYVLIGFEGENGWLYGADHQYGFYGDETLTAQWAPIDDDTVLFVVENSDMKFKNGEWYVTRPAGEAVSVPGRDEFYLYGEDPYQTFLGWTNVSHTSFPSDSWEYDWSSPEAVATEKAIWYQEGTTAEISGGTILYGSTAYTNSNIVRYDPNGGENPKGGNCVMRAYYPVDFDGTLYVLDNEEEFTFVRDGYVFVGWNTKADGSGKWLAEGTALPYIEMEPTNVHVLYAQWAKIESDQVLFMANGVTFADGSRYQYLSADGEVEIPGQHEMTMDDRTMLGWADVEFIPVKSNALSDEDYANMEGFEELWQKAMNAAWFAPGQAADIPGGTVLYAQKAPAEYNVVRYDGNGGLDANGGNSAVRGLYCAAEEGTSLYVLDNGDEFTFASAGLEFVGWNTEADGSGEWMNPGDELLHQYRPNDPYVHILYAQWEAESFEYEAAGDAGDQVTFSIAPAVGRVGAEISVTSVKNSTPYKRTVQAYVALYNDEKMIAVTTEALDLTADGVFDKLTVRYDPSLEPSQCKVILLDTDGQYAPVCTDMSVMFR